MQDSFSRLATSACVGTHSHELWLDLVMRKRRSSTVMREWLSLTVPSLSPPATLCVAHYPFPVVLPLFQRGSIFFSPVFVNLTWSAVNKSICALERNCWCWILVISHNIIATLQHHRCMVTRRSRGRTKPTPWTPSSSLRGRQNQVRGLPGGHTQNLQNCESDTVSRLI